MKWMALFFLVPCAAAAQSFGDPPAVVIDGTAYVATETDVCINDQITKGPAGLVTRAASGCIGYSARECTADPVACSNFEQSYWEWRIAKNYEGLQAWIADRPDSETDDLDELVANPAAATANVALECAMRIGQMETATAAQDKATCEMRETALIALELEFTVRQACDSADGGSFARFCDRTDP